MLAVLVPVFLRRRYKKDIDAAATDDTLPIPQGSTSPYSSPRPSPGRIPTPVPYTDDNASIIGHAPSVRSFEIGSDDEEDDDDDEEAGEGQRLVKGKAQERERRKDGNLGKASKILGVEVSGRDVR